MPNQMNKGFSLIELVMVIIILGILAATAIPRFASQSAYDERFFYEDVLAGLRYSHKLAMTSGCRVEFDRTANGFELQHDNNCFNAASAADFSLDVYRPGEGVGYSIDSWSGDTSWTSDDNPLIFTPRGQVTDTGGSVLNSTTLSAGGRSIIIDGQTGFIR